MWESVFIAFVLDLEKNETVKRLKQFTRLAHRAEARRE
jgi:hypothetical protein